MNIEVFSYSVQASILGMVIVFSTLVILWIFMIILKRLFDRPPGSGDASGETLPKAAPSAAERGPAVCAPAPGETGLWLAAAVAAYLAAEDAQAPSPGAWLPSGGAYPDPWVFRAAFDKTYPLDKTRF
jgi:Na+-transporting methylmalonyl-CoA/oxaloacetate decarboxylase gamma subunit